MEDLILKFDLIEHSQSRHIPNKEGHRAGDDECWDFDRTESNPSKDDGMES